MKKINKIFLTLFSFAMFSVFMIVPFTSNPNFAVVSAQDNADQNLICQIFPFLDGIILAENLCDNTNDDTAATAATSVGQWIRFGVSLIFVGIIAIAIFYIIKSAIKYIRSEGDEGQVEEATKAIKSVFIGVAALILGVIGLVIILSLFNASSGSQFEDPDTRPGIVDNLLTGTST